MYNDFNLHDKVIEVIDIISKNSGRKTKDISAKEIVEYLESSRGRRFCVSQKQELIKLAYIFLLLLKI